MVTAVKEVQKMDPTLPQGADSLQGDKARMHIAQMCALHGITELPTAAGLELLQAGAEPARSPEPAQCLVPVFKNVCHNEASDEAADSVPA